MNYLEKIIGHKRSEVAEAKRQMPLGRLQELIAAAPPTVPFAQSIRNRNGIIAEFKRRSPSKGVIHGNIRPTDVVAGYEQAGVSAISVLTDSQFFGGSLADLQEARPLVGIPLLRKEFVIDSHQLYEARAFGASAVLLIAAVLSPGQTAELAAEAAALGLETLLELHNEDEFGHIGPDINVVGINNRNLKTFEVDLDHSVRMAGMLPGSLPKISESGIRTIDDMLMLRRGGFDGFLIGENFMRSNNPAQACIDFCKKYTEQLCKTE